MLNQKKTMESVFLRSAIQATEATHTGWMAQTEAATQAPGTARRASTRQSSTAPRACNRTFVR